MKTLYTIGFLLGLALAFSPAPLATTGDASSSKPVDRNAYADTWNDIEAAVERFNVTRAELGENINKYPPWRVFSEPKQMRRRELYDAAARDAEVMAKRYRQLRDFEK